MIRLDPQPASRRSFLKFGAAALAGAALLKSAPALAADAAASADYAGLPMGAQSYTFRSMSFAKATEAMQQLGLTHIEIYSGHVTGMSPKQVQEQLAKTGITFVSYGVIPFNQDEAHARKMFELAKTYGLKNLSCDPGPESFDILDKLTEEYDVTVAIHPHGPGHRWAKVETIQNAIKDHSKRIGLCADTGHLIRAGEDPVKACETFKDRLHAMHLKDFKKLDNGKWEDVPAAQGSLDVDALVKFMLDNNYKGGLFIEYEGGEPVKRVQESLDRVKQAVKKAKPA